MSAKTLVVTIALILGFVGVTSAQRSNDSTEAARTLLKIFSLCNYRETNGPQQLANNKKPILRITPDENDEQPKKPTPQQVAIFKLAAVYIIFQGDDERPGKKRFCNPQRDEDLREATLNCTYIQNQLYGYSSTGKFRIVSCKTNMSPNGAVCILKVSVYHQDYKQGIIFKLLKVDSRWGLFYFDALDEKPSRVSISSHKKQSWRGHAIKPCA